MIGSSAYVSHFAPQTAKLMTEVAKGKNGFFIQHADFLSGLSQSNRYNPLAGSTFILGSSTGAHIIPSPLAPIMSAVRFQLAAGKKIMFPVLGRLTGNRSRQSMNMYNSLTDMISWVENNMAHYDSRDWMHDNGAIFRKARNALQAFKDITPDEEARFVRYIERVVKKLDKRRSEIQESHPQATGEALLQLLRKDKTFQKDIKNAFWGEGLEVELASKDGMNLFDPRNPLKGRLLIGDNGILTQLGKLLGSAEEMKKIDQEWAKAMQQRQPAHMFPNAKPAQPPTNSTTRTITPGLLASTGALAGGITLAGLLGSKQALAEPEEEQSKELSNLPRHDAARRYHQIKVKEQDNNAYSLLNGKLLDSMSWLSSIFVVAPSLHRFMNAACLAGALYGGMKFSTALAGRGLRGEVLGKDKIWPIFKPIHNKMPYVWKGQTKQDRARYTIHQLIPVTAGAFGTYIGSGMFFQNRVSELKKAEYLEDYTDKVSMDESASYARASAATSILNTGSGFHLLPFIGYDPNLQNRFLMGTGQQVATPGLGKLWSNNPSKYPYHIKKLLNVMIEYSVHNPSEFPKEYDNMAHAVIAKLYPKLPPREMQEKEDAFVDALYAVRDKYWQEGGIPENREEECKADLETHFRKEGLEKTFLSIGLDPLKAQIDNNGLSGKFANLMGSRTQVKRDIAAYHHKARHRIANHDTPQTTIPAPVEHMQMNLASKENAESQLIS